MHWFVWFVLLLNSFEQDYIVSRLPWFTTSYKVHKKSMIYSKPPLHMREVYYLPQFGKTFLKGKC